jgi:TatD DNase family protein
MIDSHCHLADAIFEADLHETVSRARAAGVTSALVILAAGDGEEARRGGTVRALWPGVGFAVGVHPHQASQCADERGRANGLIRDAFRIGDVLAVGEIGLDYHYDFSPRDVQQRVFIEQIHTARSLGRPVVIHTREADDDTFEILKAEGGGELRGVFHCFTGGPDRARRALDLGFHLSFAGILTFATADDLRAAAALTPDDRLLVETDSPFLAPVPFRGKRNEPAHVARVVETLAAVRGRPAQFVEELTDANFIQLFGLPTRPRVDTPRASML